MFWRKGDSKNPDPRNACHLRAKGVPLYMDDRAMAIAHKDLPCGAEVIVLNPRTLRWVRARRWDWGPVHAMVDMSRAVAKAVKLNGLEPVWVLPL